MQPAAKRDHANLDLLRAVAVLAVLADHLLEYIGDRIGMRFHPLDWRLGRMGVLLFFVHTSYVLMLSLQRLRASRANLYLDFMVRRVFRIFPLSILAVAVMVTFRIPSMGWTPAFEAPTTGELLANLALAQNLTYARDLLAPLWSLPIEVQMYLTLPVLFHVVARPGAIRIVAGLWLLSVAAALVQPLVAGRLTFVQFGPCFIAGVAAFVVSRRVSPRLPSWTWPVALTGLAAGYLAAAEAMGTVHPPAAAWCLCVGIGLMIPHAQDITQRHVVCATHLVARYSYGVYLSHVILMWLVFVRMPALSPWAQGALLIVLLVVAPVACYHLVEEPCQRFGARVAERIARAERSVRGASSIPRIGRYAFLTSAPNTSSASSTLPNGAET